MGKTKKLNEIKNDLVKSDNIVFYMNNLEAIEKFNVSATKSSFSKEYWHNFLKKIEQILTIESPLQKENFTKEFLGSLKNKYENSTTKINSGIINIRDQITKILLKNEDAKFEIKKNSKFDDVKLSNLSFRIVDNDLMGDLYDFFDKLIEKNRGSGNYQYLTIKIIYELISVNLFPASSLEKVFLIIDEPELYLHPSLQRRVGKMLKKISEKVNIAISTHSEKIASLVIENPHVKIYTAKKYDDFFEQKISIFARQVGEEARLGFVKNLFANKIIIVEGNNDLDLVEHLINIIEDEGDEIDLNYNVHIAPNKSNIPSIYKTLIDEYKIPEKQIMIIYDKDGDLNKPCREHGAWNSKIAKLESKNIFWFDGNLEEDLKTTKDGLKESKKNGEINSKFLQFSKESKYIELKDKLKLFLKLDETK